MSGEAAGANRRRAAMGVSGGGAGLGEERPVVRHYDVGRGYGTCGDLSFNPSWPQGVRHGDGCRGTAQILLR